jgi:CBS-domain-containing membrane protein
MRRFITLHQPRNDMRKTVLAGLGGAVAIGFLGFLTISSGHALLMAPFGASCVLLFSVPASPLSQPCFAFLLLPVLAGAVGLVAIAAAFHVTTSTNYPLNKPS